ncbi:hypothetical protein CHS0354_005927 [Potamilus streckersoni]|uniref:Uncharacterized protein n=1 Tax=Potamilus streckersoni TaxID=2493646 RepID=A0AAE0W636_9BIVA|nr:hypothetical protein CHS0354_005927 [Potamilus streckersoni]
MSHNLKKAFQNHKTARWAHQRDIKAIQINNFAYEKLGLPATPLQINCDSYLSSLTKTNHTNPSNEPPIKILSPTSLRKEKHNQATKTNGDHITDVESAINKLFHKNTQHIQNQQITDPSNIPNKKPKNITIDRTLLGTFHTNSELQIETVSCYNRIQRTNTNEPNKQPDQQPDLHEPPNTSSDPTVANKTLTQTPNNQLQLGNKQKMHYAQDHQIPGPSTTHTPAELEEIRQELDQTDYTHQNLTNNIVQQLEFE